MPRCADQRSRPARRPAKHRAHDADRAQARWIDALHARRRARNRSRVVRPAKLLPQMADAAERGRHALTLARPDVTALVPNLKGAEAALGAGAHKLTLPVSVSEAHSLANVRKTPRRWSTRCAASSRCATKLAPQVRIEAGLSTAFGCTMQGAVTEDEVMRMAVLLAEAGADEIGLSDTSGYANPAQVRRLFTRLQARDRRARPAARTSTTRAAWASPTSWPRSRSACAPSMRRRAASAAARTRRARPATSSPRTWCSCSSRWACAPASTSSKLIAARAICARRCPASRSTACRPTPGLTKGFVYADGRCPGAEPHACAPRSRHEQSRPMRCRSPACASSSSPTW